MSAKANNLKIGLFVIAALTLLVIGLLAFGARSYFEEKTAFETAMAGDVNGLSVGSPVELRGVPIGKVTQIDFIWNEYPQSKLGYVIVEFEVGSRIAPQRDGEDIQASVDGEIKMGLRATLKNQGITGTSLLALEYFDARNNPPLPIDYRPRHYYIPSVPGQFTRLLESVEKSLQKFERLDLASISHSITNALGSATLLAEKIDKIDMRKLADSADTLLTELKTTSLKLNATLDEIQTTIKGLKLDAIGQNADGLLLGLRDTNQKLQTVLNHVGAVPFAETVGEIRGAADTLNGVLLELKQYPSGFLFGEPPPPARAVQPPRK